MAEFLQLSEHGLALRPNRKANHLLASFKGQNRRLNDLELTEELCKGTVKLTLRLLVSYIYGALILDVSRSHTTTHHSR